MRMNLPVTGKECEMVDNTTWAISKSDLQGLFTYASEDLCDVSGYTLEELLGEPHNIFRHPDMPPAIFAELWQTIQAGQEWQGVIKNRHKCGDYFWVYATVYPMLDKAQECIGYMNIRRHATKEQIAEAEARFKELAT